MPFAVSALPALSETPEKLPYLAAVAILSSVIPYTLEFAALRRLDTHTFGVLLSLEPAVAAVAGWSLLGQTLGWTDTLAISAVVIASVVATFERRAPVERPAPIPAPVHAG